MLLLLLLYGLAFELQTMIGLSLEPNFLGGGVGGQNNTTFENKESETIVIIICSCY